MLKKLFVKYIIGKCKHDCKLCSYRKVCDVNYNEYTWNQLLRYYKYIKSVKEQIKRGKF